ncbi:MAG: FapA family protein [Spirochaetes bacterium]|nr:FapA family protein [Spirochaetota bacterium]
MDRLKELLIDETEESFQSEGVQPPEGGAQSGAEEFIEVEAYSIEEGLEHASKKLKTSIADLEYEILERGSSGFLGIGRRPYRILIKRLISRIPEELKGVTEMIQKGEAVQQDADGEFKIRVTKQGMFLIVKAPRGRGRRISLQEVQNALYERQISEIDVKLIEGIVNKARGKPVKIGEWQPNPDNDGKMSIEISEDEMKSYLTLIPPRRNGRIVELDDVVAELNKRNIIYGVKESAIKEAIENDQYNQPVLIAEGIPSHDGADARVEFKFKVDKEIQLEEDESGKVDFKELDLIENVVVGQVLATKVPPQKGQTGKTITGREIPSKDGRDIQLQPGKNVKVSEDRTQMIAEINGQVVYNKGRISVEPVYEVKGDVSLDTGNIVFLGTVIVRGNVEDGFSVKAAGNIDIRGNVGKAQLEAEGDIIIKQGLLGKDEAEIVAGNDIIAKFIERAKRVEAGRDILVSEGIMHSFVDAGKRVVCNGRRAMIVGGRVRAGEEVNAKVIGSPSFTETIVEVGLDPKSRQQLIELGEEFRNSKEKVHELNMNITTLQTQKKTGGGKLSPDKEEMLLNMLREKEELSARMAEIEDQIQEIRAYLTSLEEKGKVAVQNVVYPKVKITVKDANLEVRDDFKYVTFVQEAGNIKVLPYEEPKVQKKE